ncbi:hypothetical protein B4W69_08395 [Staphylococcus delphini]|nr:hypothetical protein B4W69_08395 [Staphylococcus delphini]
MVMIVFHARLFCDICWFSTIRMVASRTGLLNKIAEQAFAFIIKLFNDCLFWACFPRDLPQLNSA